MKIRDRLESCLAQINDPAGEGKRAFIRLYTEQARAVADAQDRLRAAGAPLGPLGGTIVAIKDLFDVEGEPTTAGSVALRDAPPARSDAPVIARLRAAGAVIVGKTNMTEFAYSGIGMNPHYGTPGNPFDRARIPGGSTSGGAVALADGMCDIAIGSDTGGSTRIPAAFCGVAGLKPTQMRIPLDGAVPLSTTLDSIGPMARTIADCARADAVMAGEAPQPIEATDLRRIRLGLCKTLVLDGMDDEVARSFERAMKALSPARLSDFTTELFAAMAQVNARGGFTAAESFAWHRDLLARRGADYDPRVRVRIERGALLSAADYIEMMQERARLVRAMDAALAEIDALVMPTVPVVAPRMDALKSDDEFMRINLQVLRNTAIANFFDLCAVSLPIPTDGLAVGLMLVGRRGSDKRLLRIAAAVETALGAAR
ncbi:MAG TPA: amidase [Alphaproteobacteria bacterium]|nr:amidase [Alphaproteobacteria bacterium]